MKKLKVLFLLIFICGLSYGTGYPLSENWQSQAETRIEQHRKEDICIHFMYNGKPVSGATIEIAMQEHEFLFGCNLFNWEGNPTPYDDQEYRRRFADLFNFATLSFFWGSYEPEKDKPKYAESEKAAKWCAENGIRVKGHPLIYADRSPAWIKDLNDEELYQRVKDRITDCVRHFAGIIDTWDVINEVVYWPATKSPGRVSQLAVKTGYADFTKECFAAARKGNSQATLLINDNNWNEKYVKLLQQLTNNEQPVYDVIGIQSHFHMASGTWPNERIWDVCEKFAQFGKPIHFTETTILSTAENCGHCDNVETTAAGEAIQRDEVVRFYTLLFSHPAVTAISWWDLSDQKAWLGAPAGLLHKDMTPKPAYNALKKLIKEDWATHTTLTTDKKGEIHLRAFRGKYNFTVTLPNGIKLEPFSDVVKKGVSQIKLKAVR